MHRNIYSLISFYEFRIVFIRSAHDTAIRYYHLISRFVSLCYLELCAKYRDIKTYITIDIAIANRIWNFCVCSVNNLCYKMNYVIEAYTSFI